LPDRKGRKFSASSKGTENAGKKYDRLLGEFGDWYSTRLPSELEVAEEFDLPLVRMDLEGKNLKFDMADLALSFKRIGRVTLCWQTADSQKYGEWTLPPKSALVLPPNSGFEGVVTWTDECFSKAKWEAYQKKGGKLSISRWRADLVLRSNRAGGETKLVVIPKAALKWLVAKKRPVAKQPVAKKPQVAKQPAVSATIALAQSMM
jgi:hypothetical protein